jgi:hypothetical protein
MNHIPNPVRGTLALPDDVNLADVDWSPVNAVETATPPRTGPVAGPDKHGLAHTRPARQQAKATQGTQAQHGQRQATSDIPPAAWLHKPMAVAMSSNVKTSIKRSENLRNAARKNRVF